MKKHTNLRKQRGIATVLIILLVGVALSASTLGVIYTVRSTQDKQVTAHATTNAQAAAWALAEAARLYLETDSGIATVNSVKDTGTAKPLTIDLSSLSHLEGSSITVNSAYSKDSKLYANITVNAFDSVSQATSQLNLVFEVTPGTSSNECPDPAESQLAGDVEGDKLDLRMEGSNENSVFTVDGSWGNPTDASALSGVDRFLVTGSVRLTGTGVGGPINKIKANEGVKINGSVDAGTIESGEYVEVTNNANIGEILAMDYVSWDSSGSTSKLQSHTTATIDNGRHEYIATGVLAQLNKTAGSSVDGGQINIDSHGDVDFASSNYTSFGEVRAMGDVTCDTNRSIAKITAGASIEAFCSSLDKTIDSDLTLTAIRDYEPVVVEKTTIADADGYDAHYSFTYDEDAAESDRLKVTVKNVNGLDGEYILYDGMGGVDRLRRPGEAASVNDPTLCVTGNNTVGCIDFIPTARVDTEGLSAAEQRPAGKWVITNQPSTLAPGIMYFDRDLEVNLIDIRINGFLSAGNIGVEEANEKMLIALNAAPSEVLCGGNQITISGSGENLALGFTPNTTWFENGTGAFPYPTDFCFGSPPAKRTTIEVEGETIAATQPFIGQFALMAGQQNPVDENETDPDANYQGGDIYLRSILNVFGRVIAGNSLKLITETNLMVWGTVGSEARREGTENTKNIMNGAITIYPDAKNLLGDTGGGNCTPTPASSGSSRLFWSRQL